MSERERGREGGREEGRYFGLVGTVLVCMTIIADCRNIYSSLDNLFFTPS